MTPTTSKPRSTSRAAVTEQVDAARHRDDEAVVGGVSGEVWLLKPRGHHFNSSCRISGTFPSREISVVIRLLRYPQFVDPREKFR